MICSRCIYSDLFPGINFDDKGVCNYCHQIDKLCDDYGTKSEKGKKELAQIINQIKHKQKKEKYDCIIGVSGGTDSSYLLMKLCDWGLRPLAVHYDNTWNSAIASQNISKITKAFNIDLYTHVINNEEHDGIKLAYLKAGVAEFDTDTDLALSQVMREAAAKFNVPYIIEGHSFLTEGISPIHGNYFDGAYVRDIVDRYGKVSIKTYPLMTFWQFLKWIIIYRQKFIRPFWYINYSKSEAQLELIRRTGWLNYGGHHLENRASAFGHQVWQPRKFGVDWRILSIAARARNGQLSRQEGINEYNSQITNTEQLEQYVRKRLRLSNNQYKEFFLKPRRTWKDFKTYKKRFEFLRPLFFIFAKAKLIPFSFYLKYCFPLKTSD